MHGSLPMLMVCMCRSIKLLPSKPSSLLELAGLTADAAVLTPAESTTTPPWATGSSIGVAGEAVGCSSSNENSPSRH
jgi:hypothetical protein